MFPLTRNRAPILRLPSRVAQQLRDLLSAVAVYAAGGRKALADYSGRKGGVVQQLTHQVK